MIEDRYVFNKVTGAFLLLILLSKRAFINKNSIIFWLMLPLLFASISQIVIIYSQNVANEVKNYYLIWLTSNFCATLIWTALFTMLRIDLFRLFAFFYISLSVFSALIIFSYQLKIGINPRPWSFFGPASVVTLPVICLLLANNISLVWGVVTGVITASSKGLILAYAAINFQLMKYKNFFKLLVSILIAFFALVVFLSYIRTPEDILASLKIRSSLYQFHGLRLINFDLNYFGLSRGLDAMEMDPHSFFIFSLLSFGLLPTVFVLMLLCAHCYISKKYLLYFIFGIAMLSETFLFKEPVSTAIMFSCILKRRSLA
ncbi:hypothetical protein OAP82_01290 [Paracoccaceae bacterium]|nr:hypothetical protein [Paracoccaceae bacterium]MDC0867648.1 hypothetical protein [Paracoccaceae bacterium]